MVNSACTSCEIGADKSAYWTPLLYYKYPNGSFFEVPHGGSVAYYLGRGPNAQNSIPFPPGFKILSGNKAARSYDNKTLTWGNATYPGRPIADRVTFVCLTAGVSPPEQPFMYNVSTCINGMRGQIAFQACWNGIDLYKADNSHVAYLSGIDNGVCPPQYPYQLPILFLETNYAPSQVPDQTPDGIFTFSQGDTTGFGFHGDFLNGWDMDVQTAAVANCLIPDNFGQISYCPVLQTSQTNGYAYNCPEQAPQIGERVHGLLDRLPGCVQLTNGPEAATAAQMECNASAPQPVITQTADSLPRPTVQPTPGQAYGLPSQQYLGCFNDSSLGIRTLNAALYVNYTAMTVEFCQAYCMALGYRLSGVEYTQECHCDNLINPTAVGGNTACNWNCGGTMTNNPSGTQEVCGGLQVINVYNNTDPNFNANGSLANTAGNAQPYTPAAGFGANYLGCYTDNTGGRTLTGKVLTQNNMSLEICAAFCSQGVGYQYYGAEYATQCYCGNVLGSGATLLTANTSPSNFSVCNYRCQGSGSEICGGSGALSLYNNTAFIAPGAKPSIGKYATQGCLTDTNTAGRSLQGASMVSASMTNEMCVKFCLGKQYHYAG